MDERTTPIFLLISTRRNPLRCVHESLHVNRSVSKWGAGFHNRNCTMASAVHPPGIILTSPAIQATPESPRSPGSPKKMPTSSLPFHMHGPLDSSHSCCHSCMSPWNPYLLIGLTCSVLSRFSHSRLCYFFVHSCSLHQACSALTHHSLTKGFKPQTDDVTVQKTDEPDSPSLRSRRGLVKEEEEVEGDKSELFGSHTDVHAWENENWLEDDTSSPPPRRARAFTEDASDPRHNGASSGRRKVGGGARAHSNPGPMNNGAARGGRNFEGWTKLQCKDIRLEYVLLSPTHSHGTHSPCLVH